VEIIGLVLALVAGIVGGIITGLAPGLHSNLVAVFLVALATNPFFKTFNPIILATAIVTLAITQTLVDFIPSIYLGAPTEDTILSILPGHALLKEGKAHQAIISATSGGLFGMLVGIILTWPLIKLAPFIQSHIINIIPFALIALVIYMIGREDNLLPALVVTLAAGFLGYVTLNIPIQEPLLPLLTGLFGTSSLIASLKEKAALPKQEHSSIRESLPEKDKT
jgi:putative membrane protein